MRRRELVIASLLALLGVASIGAISVLQGRADDGQAAQLRIASIRLELASLQSAPFKATANSGGSPAFAQRLLREGAQQIATDLEALRSGAPPVALDRLQAPLEANIATLQHIYRIGVATGQYPAQADRLSGVAAREQISVNALLSDASGAYAGRADRDRTHVTLGAAAAIVLLLLAFGFVYGKNGRLLEASQQDALVDALTGLGNRRALERDLAAWIERATSGKPIRLGLFDLDGFKQYNDTFGHPAGDALLARLGEHLRSGLQGNARVYRMGGDEFCLLSEDECSPNDEQVHRAAEALCESGESFSITCSYGSVRIPQEATSSEQALHLADQRMYSQKTASISAGRQSSDVLCQVLSERSDSLHTHVDSVGRLARELAMRLGLSETEQERIYIAAELHDIGKTAIPDSLLDKCGPLDELEWAYMRTHTLIGERIVLAAPALAPTAELIRASHERVDGTGYPDQLLGSDIPIGARIISICDAFDAMISDRPYRKAMPVAAALAELETESGSQFDAELVHAFCELVTSRDRELALA